MNIFKKIFKKKTKDKKEEKKNECWYNNSHEQPKKKLQWSNPNDDGGAGGEGAHMEMAVVRSMTDRQC
jgi:hypothetical protein